MRVNDRVKWKSCGKWWFGTIKSIDKGSTKPIKVKPDNSSDGRSIVSIKEKNAYPE